MGVLSAEWQRSAVQTHQAHGTETPVRTQNIFPDEVFRYVDDIRIGVYLKVHRREEEHGGWIELVDKVVGEVSREGRMPTAPDKHERLVLRRKMRRKKNRGKEVKWVKWLGIIVDKELSFDTH